jgi:hypothetical protein
MASFFIDNAQSIGAVGQLFSAIFAAGIVYQVSLMRKQTNLMLDQAKAAFDQTKADHDALRRRTALDVMTKWIEMLPSESRALEVLFGVLDKEQCHCIQDIRPLSVDASRKNMVISVLKKHFIGIEDYVNKNIAESYGRVITLNEDYVGYIRLIAAAYINHIEIVMCAWRHNVADQAMIEEQFEDMLANDGDPFKLFKDMNGGSDAFPATYHFIENVNNAKKPSAGKAPTA